MTAPISVMAIAAQLPPAELDRILDAMSPRDIAVLEVVERYHWENWARPKQLEPPPRLVAYPSGKKGSWRWWMIVTGRGWGKTRTAAEATNRRIREWKLSRPMRIGIAGPTTTRVREEMIEGPDGILECSPPWFKPRYESSKARITWPGGVAVARLFSAEEPDTFRGPSLDWMWLEELQDWRHPAAFYQGADHMLRKGDAQGVITATPSRRELFLDLALGKKGKDGERPGPRRDFIFTGGSTYENAHNLAAGYLSSVVEHYEGTAIGEQEIHGMVPREVEGALWRQDEIEAARVSTHPQLAKVVVAVDPTRSPTGSGDECGIVAAGRGVDGNIYILEDCSLRASPDAWGRQVIGAYRRHSADEIVAESNFSGEVVRRVVLGRAPNVKVRLVQASRGKRVRAEPVHTLYDKNRRIEVGGREIRAQLAFHVVDPVKLGRGENPFAVLEEEMVTTDFEKGIRVSRERSPNRVDALVWAISSLVDRAPIPAASPLSIGTRESPWRQ